MLTFLCPNISWTERKSAPFCSKVVAKECLTTWGLTLIGNFADLRYFSTILCIVLTDNLICSPAVAGSALVPEYRIHTGRQWSSLATRNLSSHLAARSLKKTTLTLLPLPTTPNSRLLISISSLFNLASSLTRKPVENSTSSIALSRNPSGSDVSGWSSSLSICSRLKNLILRPSALGNSTFSGDKLLIPFLLKYFKKARRAITW